MADQGCVWLFGRRSKSVGADLAYGLFCTPALSVTQSTAAAAVGGLWYYISVLSALYFCVCPGGNCLYLPLGFQLCS